MHAIVLVGGKATRLWPRTRSQPKALVRIGQYPILEIIIRRLRDCGFDRITLCIAHLGEMIKREFGDGRHLGVTVDYCTEESPLGTAAPLHLVRDWTTPAVVMNGDILTTVDFADLYRRHTTSGNLLTVAFHQSVLCAGVGVLHVRDGLVQQIWEKPQVEWNISAGVYVADPRVLDYIPRSDAADMPGLINALLADGRQVTGYGFRGQWYDIGTPFRYQKAMKEFLAHPDRYLTADASRRANGSGHRVEVALEPDGDRLSVAELSPWS